MSAIFGILDLARRSVDLDWIKSMQDDLIHRGPDGQGLYQENSLVLGHMLLQVTPESVYDKSPFEEDGFVITANARLDEREALMDRLNINFAEREKTTDSVLLLRSYRKWGKDFVKDIYGDFSFAIWDKQKKELFCARDQIGVKPFLYYFQDNYFVFSTEIKSIVKLPFVKTEVDQGQLRDQAIGIFNNPEITIWRNIHRLTAACTLSFIGKQISTKKYWQPCHKRNLFFKTEKQSAEALLKILIKVISDHSRVIKGVGIPLSGGLDSSTIACLAVKEKSLKDKNIITASSVINPQYPHLDTPDEMEYIQAVLEQEKKIDPTFVYNTDFDFLGNLDEKFDRHYSTVNYSYYIDEALYKKFKLKSVRRILSGFLGDITTSNSTIFPLPYLLFSGRFNAFLKLNRIIKKKSGKSWSHHILYNIIVPILPLFMVKLGFQIKGHSIPWCIRDLPLNLNSAEKFQLQKRKKTYYKNFGIFQFEIYKNIWPAPWEAFEEDWDCGSSHHQVEISYPLLDRRVLELLLQLPPEHFYAEGMKRGLIRKAMRNIIPEKVRIRQNKMPYSPDFHHIIQRGIMNFSPYLKDKRLPTKMENMIDKDKMILQLENLAKSKTYRKFEGNYWSILMFSIWTSFNNWAVNKK